MKKGISHNSVAFLIVSPSVTDKEVGGGGGGGGEKDDMWFSCVIGAFT